MWTLTEIELYFGLCGHASHHCEEDEVCGELDEFGGLSELLHEDRADTADARQALQVVLAADDLIVARVRHQLLLVHDHEAGCGGAQAGAAEGLEAEAALVVSVTHRPRPEAAHVHVALAAHVAFNRAAEGLLPQEVDGARGAEEAEAAPGGLLARCVDHTRRPRPAAVIPRVAIDGAAV